VRWDLKLKLLENFIYSELFTIHYVKLIMKNRESSYTKDFRKITYEVYSLF